MKMTLFLSVTLAVLSVPLSTDVQAQDGQATEQAMEDRSSRDSGSRIPGARKDGSQGTKAKRAPPVPALFPKATRAEPAQAASGPMAKKLKAMFDLKQAKGNPDQQIAMADAILADPKAGAFDKSSAGYVAAAAWMEKNTGDYTNNIKYVRGAINDGGLNNNTHYQLMLQLAQMLAAAGQNAEALTYADRYLAETQSEDPLAYNVRAQVALAGDKPEQAAAALEKLHAAKPGDKQVMFNLAILYTKADQPAKAGQLVDKLRAGGHLTTGDDYERAFAILASIEGRDKEAVALMQEAVDKKLVTPGYNLYLMQGNAYYEANQIPQTIDAWSKGAPLAKDGTMFLNVAKLQAQEEQWAQAKTSAQSALAKGVQKPAEAWQVIASSEAALGNKAAAEAATRQATKGK